MKTQRNRAEVFYARFDEDWEVMEKYDKLRSMREV